MKLDRDNGDLRLTIKDRESELRIKVFEDELHLRLSDEFDYVHTYLSRQQVRDLLPHLAAFAETGRLEVSDDDD